MSLRTGWVRLLAAGLAVLLAVPASAQEILGNLDAGDGQPIEITADQIVFDGIRQVYVARGSVQVVQGDRRIGADWIVFNRTTRRGIAAGNVRAESADDVLEARFIEFDNTAQQGLVLTGRLDLGEEDFRIAAGELVKEGETTYTGEDVSMTTCRCPDDADRLPWVINADHADLEIGGYATVTNSTVDILGVPALWIPWAFFPVKTERATGFLLPEMRLGGGNGFEFALPFFWAARDDVNVTATPRYMTARGFKPEVLVETVFGQRSSLEVFGSYIRDQNPDEVSGFQNGQPVEGDLYDENRFGVGVDADVHLPLGLRLRSDVQIISDNEYVRDFEEFNEYRRDRFVESQVFGFGHFGRDGSAAAVVSATYRNDRQNPDQGISGSRRDRDAYLLHRAPTADLAWLPTRLEEAFGLELGFGMEYANFWSYKRASSRLDLSDPTDGGVVGDDRFVDIGIGSIPGLLPLNGTQSRIEERARFGVNDGVFQEGEPLNDDGHRFFLNPHIGHSFRLFDTLDVRPEVGWHQTFYTTDAKDFDSRGFLTARLDVHTQAMRAYDLGGGRQLSHLLEPRLGWALVQKTGQSKNPLFVPQTAVPQDRIRQMSLDNFVLDDADRIDPANVVTLGLGNHFYVGSGKRQRLAGELDLSVAYDFRGQGAFGLGIVEGRLLPFRRLQGSFNFAYDLQDRRVDQGLFDLAIPLDGLLFLGKSSRIQLGYRYRGDVGLFFENFESVVGVNSVQGTFNRFEEEFDRINQVSAATRLRITDNWAIDYQLSYSIEGLTILTNRGAIEFTSSCRCWAIQGMVENNRTRGLRGGINFTLLGFGMSRDEPFRGGGMLGTGAL